MGKSKKETVTQKLDANTQRFVDQMRQQAQSLSSGILSRPASSFFTGPIDQSTILQNAQGFMNPYQQQVIGGLNDQFSQDLSTIGKNADQAATGAGAFGGSRALIQKGAAQGQAALGHEQQVANLLNSGYANALNLGFGLAGKNQQLRQRQLLAPIFQAQAAQGLLNSSVGPHGQTQTQTQSGNFFGDLFKTGLGGLETASGLGWAPFAKKGG